MIYQHLVTNTKRSLKGLLPVFNILYSQMARKHTFIRAKHIFIYAQTYLHTRVHIIISANIFIRAYISTYARTYLHTRVHIFIRAYISSYARTYLHTRTYISSYIRIIYMYLGYNTIHDKTQHNLHSRLYDGNPQNVLVWIQTQCCLHPPYCGIQTTYFHLDLQLYICYVKHISMGPSIQTRNKSHTHSQRGRKTSNIYGPSFLTRTLSMRYERLVIRLEVSALSIWCAGKRQHRPSFLTRALSMSARLVMRLEVSALMYMRSHV